MLVSKMKSCSVPQIGDKWEWKQFNKAVAATAAKSKAAAPVATSVPVPNTT
jgi:hypothetical protein